MDGLFPSPDTLIVGPALDAVAAQAIEADRTRTVSRVAIDAVKATDVMRMAASEEIGGLGASILDTGRELEAVAGACTSTAWCLWNHLSVFHLFAGTLGPDQSGLLSEMTRAHEWVSFPGGAGTGVYGAIGENRAVLNGKAAFGSGSRYGDWIGVAFAVAGDDGRPIRPLDLRFTTVRAASQGVKIEPTWDGLSVRASATDDVHYVDVEVPIDRCMPWFGVARAETLREIEVIHPRYREDWIGLSDLWLLWMGIGVAKAALADVTGSVPERRAILGAKMAERPSVVLNIGRVGALLAGATAAAESGCREVDERIAAAGIPQDHDYYRQQAIATVALDQIHEAMDLLLRTLGGNGLREGGDFERRWRDLQAFPLHINAHRDRIGGQLGRLLLGQDLEKF